MLRLTPRQRLIWVEDRLHPGAALNVVMTLLEITGEINIEAFCLAFKRVVQRHDALRMTFDSSNPIPHLHVSKLSEPCIDFVDLTAENFDQVSYEFWLKCRLSVPLSTNIRLFDAALIKRREHFWTFLLVRHHINSDNASSIILHKELEACYLDIISGGIPNQADQSCAPSYARHLLDVAACEFTQDAKASEHFWRRRHVTKPPPLKFYGAAPLVRSALYARVSRTVNIKLGRLIEALSPKTSPSIVFAITFLAFLRRVTGNEDLSIGVPLHNRTNDTAHLIGLIMEICPNRIWIGPSDTFEDVLGKFKQEIDEVRSHRKYTVSSRQAGYEVLFNFLPDVPNSFAGHKANYVHISPLALLDRLGAQGSNGLEWRDREKLSLTVQRAEGTHLYELNFDFNRGVFPKAELRDRAADHFIVMLQAFLCDPTQTIDQVDILTEQERSLLFSRETVPPLALKSPRTIVDLIEERAKSSPHVTAIEGCGTRLTYSQLKEEVKALAAHLTEGGVRGGTSVAIFVDRSPRMIVALLAVLRAGAAYVPIDPRLPDDRIGLILQDIEPSLVLSETALRPKVEKHRLSRVLCLDEIKFGRIGENAEGYPAPHDLAYMIHTSGSTGRPKAVPITHAQLSEFLIALSDRIGIKSEDRVLATTTIAFDIHTVEMFLPLITGACVIVAPSSGALDARMLAQIINDRGVTIMQGTPSLFRMLLASGWVGKQDLTILCGADVLSLGLGKALCERSRTVWNLYGPTEATVWATAKRVVASEYDNISVGSPLSGTKIYVLTPAGTPTPIGVPGEIYIGGARIARGYHGRPELTQQSFLSDPFSPLTKALMYRTGDFGRFREDLELEFVGRVDNQVKIRSIRVELEEIEAHAVQHRSVAACVAKPFTDGTGETAISVYVELARGDDVVDQHQFLSFLRGRLPDYMVPSRVFVVDLLPRSPIGKIDRIALRDLPADQMVALKRSPDAPATELEAAVLSIWRQLLSVNDLSVSDNFFDAGGHSILTLALMLEIESQLGIEVSLETIFERPTVRELCVSLSESIAKMSPGGFQPMHWGDEFVFESKSAIVMPLRSERSSKILYFTQDTFDYSALSDSLTREISTASVNVNGLQWLRLLVDGRDIVSAIDRISDAYAEAIIAERQAGPIYLAGYSFGGILAVETACKLEEHGVPPDAIFLFDPHLHNSVRHILYDMLRSGLSAFRFNAIRSGSRHENGRLGRFLTRYALNRPTGSTISAKWRRKRGEDVGSIFRGLRNEASQAYLGPVRTLTCHTVLFRATKPLAGRATEIRADIGWARRLEENLTVVLTPGDHRSLLDAENVSDIATEINRQLGSKGHFRLP